MTDPVAAVAAFARAVEASIDAAVHEITANLWMRRRERVEEVAWLSHRNGDAEVVLTLRDGSEYRGRGGGRLDALVELERATSRVA